MLSDEELRIAAGLDAADTTHDDALATWGLQAAAALAGACGIAKAGYDVSLAPLRGEAPVTFKAETLVQTFRIRPSDYLHQLYLARWPVLSIVSVTVDATALTRRRLRNQHPVVVDHPRIGQRHALLADRPRHRRIRGGL